MKKLLCLCLFSFLVGESYSQSHSLNLNPDSRKDVFIVEPIIKFTELNSQFATLLGLKLDFILSNKYEIGFKVNLLMNYITPLEYEWHGESPRMELLYFGIEPGYKFNISNLFSFYASIFGGYGYTTYRHISGTFEGKYFGIVEPAVNFVYQFVEWLELKIGTNYRFAFNVDQIHYSTPTIGFSPGEYDVPIEINNFSIEVGLRFLLSRF